MKNRYTFFLSGWTEIVSTSEEEARKKVIKLIEPLTNMSIDDVEKSEEIVEEKIEEPVNNWSSFSSKKD